MTFEEGFAVDQRLKEMKRLAEVTLKLCAYYDGVRVKDPDADKVLVPLDALEVMSNLAAHVLAMDGWLAGGNKLPDEWKR